MSKVRKPPSEIAGKQIRRVQDAIPDIEAGIKRVKVNPCELAADQVDKAVANYAASKGKMERNLRAVTLVKWQGKTLAKVGRISSGIEESRSTLEAFHKQRNDWQDEIDGGLSNMPKRTLEDSKRRMIYQMVEMNKKSFDKSKVVG